MRLPQVLVMFPRRSSVSTLLEEDISTDTELEEDNSDITELEEDNSETISEEELTSVIALENGLTISALELDEKVESIASEELDATCCGSEEVLPSSEQP
jgi:hypothetical protein